MGERFWMAVLGSVIGGLAVILIGQKFFPSPMSANNSGGGGPQNAGAKAVQPFAVYPDTQSQPAWFVPDPASDLYNSSYGVTANQAGRAGTQDFFGDPLGRRKDSATLVIPAKTNASIASRRN